MAIAIPLAIVFEMLGVTSFAAMLFLSAISSAWLTDRVIKAIA